MRLVVTSIQQYGERRIGTVTLKDGRAIIDRRLKPFVEGLRVVEPGSRPPRRLSPADGEEYIRALELQLSGSRIRAEIQ